MNAHVVSAVDPARRGFVRRWIASSRRRIHARFAIACIVLASTLALTSSCESKDEWLPSTVTGTDANARVVDVTPVIAGTARIWKGNNFRFEKSGAWLLDSDERADDYCATGVTWRFPASEHRIWKDMGIKAGMCGTLKQFRKAEVMWAP